LDDNLDDDTDVKDKQDEETEHKQDDAAVMFPIKVQHIGNMVQTREHSNMLPL